MNTVVQYAEVIINDGDTPWPCEVTIDQERIDVSSDRAVKPDRSWEHVDAQGHFHAFTEGRELPTLKREAVRMPCDGSCGGTCGGEGYTVDRYTCRVCGEEIDPRYVPDTAARHATIPGPKSVTVAVYSTRPVRNLHDDVTVRVRSGAPLDAMELLGVGRVVAMNASSDDRWETTIAVRSLEPRLSA